jgi:hypothetical protein
MARVLSKLVGISLPPTLLFDYSALKKLTKHVMMNIGHYISDAL